MSVRTNETATVLGPTTLASFGFAAALFGCLLAMAAPSAVADETLPPVLEFVQPTNNAVFSAFDEIPIVLQAVAPNDLILAADEFSDQQKIATVSYCCWSCPCARPL